jgi:hypothetical protein
VAAQASGGVRVRVRVHDVARLPLSAVVGLTTGSRSYHWNRVRCDAGLSDVDLYTATRHYFGWYAWNVLGLDARDIALHFGHQDGGELARKTYGHPDAKLARERVREAFRQAPALPVPLAATLMRHLA